MHRDMGFFFIGMTLIYGLSGIALNHLQDWNPNYVVTVKNFHTDLNLENPTDSTVNLITGQLRIKSKPKHFAIVKNSLKIYYPDNLTVIIDPETGDGYIEHLRKRPVFYQVNYLHYNPNRAWTWFSDLFALALIFFAISSLFMVKGKHGLRGTGGIYLLLGLMVPLLFLLFAR